MRLSLTDSFFTTDESTASERVDTCWAFMNTGYCPRGFACPWSHEAPAGFVTVEISYDENNDPAYYTSDGRKLLDCVDFRRGNCTRGDRCRFFHPPSHLYKSHNFPAPQLMDKKGIAFDENVPSSTSTTASVIPSVQRMCDWQEENVIVVCGEYPNCNACRMCSNEFEVSNGNGQILRSQLTASMRSSSEDTVDDLQSSMCSSSTRPGTAIGTPVLPLSKKRESIMSRNTMTSSRRGSSFSWADVTSDDDVEDFHLELRPSQVRDEKQFEQTFDLDQRKKRNSSGKTMSQAIQVILFKLNNGKDNQCPFCKCSFKVDGLFDHVRDLLIGNNYQVDDDCPVGSKHLQGIALELDISSALAEISFDFEYASLFLDFQKAFGVELSQYLLKEHQCRNIRDALLKIELLKHNRSHGHNGGVSPASFPTTDNEIDNDSKQNTVSVEVKILTRVERAIGAYCLFSMLQQCGLDRFVAGRLRLNSNCYCPCPFVERMKHG